MKWNLWQKRIARMMALCLLMLLLPAAGAQNAFVKAMAASADVVNYQNASEFMALCDRAQTYEARTEGEWIYAVIQPENYAVILAHTNADAKALQVPDRLGGADVVALAAGALADHHALESVSLPGNVNAIGKGAIPAGTLVCGYHGTYAHAYALQSGYAFGNLSDFNFAEGVVDYADIRVDAFTRHSAYSLTLRKLEASRLETGSVFFLVDPNNAYQISYYRVVSMKDAGNGFVSIRCETPVMDDVLRSFSGTDEKMMLDLSTLRLNEGVTHNIPRGMTSSESVDLDLNFEFSVGSLDVTVKGGYTAAFSVPSYEGEEDSKKSATMELSENLHATVTVETGLNAADERLKLKDFSDIKNIAADLNDHAGKMQSMPKHPYSYPLGVGYVFSYAGIVTVEAHFGAEFEIKGGGTVTVVYETVTTYSGDTDGNTTKKSVVEKKSIDPKAEIEVRVGVKAEASLYLTAVCVFQVSGFAGAEITASYEAISWDLAKTKFIAGINTLDCLRLQAHFIVEVGIKAGILKIFNIDVPLEISVKTEFKLVDITLVDRHRHMLEEVLTMELLSGKVSFSGIAKDVKHDTKDCPYGKSSLEVRLSRKVGEQKTQMMEFAKLDAGFTINEPEDPTEKFDELRISGWYSSDKPTAADRVSFPYTIRDGANVLYAVVQEKQYVHFIYEDGTEIAPAQYLFPGETIVLPPTDPNRVILKWAQVESPAFLVERETVKIELGATEVTMPTVPSDIYLCAFEAPTIQVHFYESVNGAPMYKTGSVESKAGMTVEAPAATEMSQRFEDFGWKVVLGESFTFPYTVPAGRITDVSLVHFLGMEPADDDFTWMSGAYGGSAHAPQSNNLKYSTTTVDGTKYAVITGRNNYDSYGNPDPLYNLMIPSTINGLRVIGIASSAFRNITTLESVTLAYGIDYIGAGAFSGCTNLRMVDLRAEETLLDINSYAFEDCTNLTDLRIHEEAFINYGDYSFKNTGLVSVYASRSVGTEAFYGCRNLQRLVVPSFCKSIGNYAFAECGSLREITMEEGLLSIGWHAFSGCRSLLELKIPDGVNCSTNLVANCTMLQTLIVGDAPTKQSFDVVPARVYSSDPYNNLPSLQYLEIGEGYTSVGKEAFKNMYALETVIFPASMETIGDSAFYGTSITDIKLTAAKNIGKNAFASNPCLQAVELSAEKLGVGVFESCPALHTAVLTSAQEISEKTFSGCVSLENISLDADTVKIGSSAFAGCESMKEFPELNKLEAISYRAFENCTLLEAIYLPEGLESVGNHAFASCTSLEELIFPDSMTLYGNGSNNGSSLIDGCSALRRLYIGGGYANLDTRHNNALYSDTTFHIGPDNNVEIVEIGEGVTALHEPFDEYYTNVETLILPSTLESIGCDFCGGTFRNFGMRSVTAGNNIKFIADDAFRGCARLETAEINAQDALVCYTVFADTPSLRSVELHGVKELENRVFQNSAVESVVLGDGIEKIGQVIFDQCPSLRSIHIADTLKSVTLDTLGSCPALEEMYVGGLTQIADLVTTGAPRVLEFGPGVESIYVEPVGSLRNLERLVLPEGLISVRRMYGIGPNLRELVLPQSLETIENGAFDSGYFETVEIPANVKLIDYSAFGNNPNLKKVVIHGEDVVIADWAFANCPQLSELIILGSVKSIGRSAFYNCGLTEVEFPDGLESIGEYAFRSNENCTRVVLPDTLKTMDSSILYESNNVEYLKIGGIEKIPGVLFGGSGEHQLKCLVLGEGVKSIEVYAFETDSYESFSHLETVVFPSTIESIGREAFRGSGLRTLVLDCSNLTAIDAYAFENCKQLERITINGSSQLTFGSSVFSGCSSLRQVELSGGITTIEGAMFKGCSALTEIDLPSTLTKISASAFADCTALKRIDLPEGLVEIGGSAFANNISLTSVSIPDSVTRLSGYRIFDGCSGIKRLRIGAGVDFSTNGGSTIMAGMPDEMEYIELAEGITDMQMIVFGFDQYSKDRVDTVILPESMTKIKETMLRNLYGASHVKLSSSVTEYIPSSGGIYYDKKLEHTTLYTDTYNDVVSSIAEKLGAAYVSLDGATSCSAQLRISLNGVAGADVFATVEGDLFSGLSLPDVPAQEGYRFSGWYYDEACTLPVRDGDRFTGAMSLYAGFIPNEVTVFAVKPPRFAQLDGATESALLPESYLQYAQVEQTDGAETQLPANPALEGYSFTGWHLDSLLRLPFENQTAKRHPAVLYGGFTPAGQGGMMEKGEDGLILSGYLPTAMDTAALVLPEQMSGTMITGIAARAFAGLNVTEITLPAGLRQVDPEAFNGAANLMTISISSSNEYFSTLDGVLYNKDRTILIRYPEGKRQTSFVVPSTVRRIEDGAFENCSKLQQIVLPDGLETIGKAAFARSGLKRAALPDSVVYLGEKAFEGCRMMTSFTAYGLQTIGRDAIPVSASLAVRGPLLEGALRDAVVPANGVNLRYNIRYLSVFNGSEEMAAYAAEAGAPLPAQAQGGTAGAGNIVYALYLDPEMSQPCEMTVMPDEDVSLYAEIRPVFASQRVTLDSGETGMMITAYNGNAGAVVLPRTVDGVSVIALGEGMLSCARGKVSSINIGSGVISIADTALSDADGLPFAGTVYADAGCYAAAWAQEKGLKLAASVYTLTFDTLGGSRIASVQAASGALLRLSTPEKTGYAFSGWYLDEACSTAASLDENGLYTVPGEDTTLYAAWIRTEEDAPAFTFTQTAEGMMITGYTGEDPFMRIPERINGIPVTGIADRAFAGSEKITAVELPKTLVSIGSSAFARMTKLSTLSIPDSVKRIGYAAFRDCPALSAVHIGSGLESLGEQAFRGAERLAAFTVSAGGRFSQVDGVLYADDGTTLACCPAGYQGGLNIAKGVVRVEPYAMAESGISSVTIPESMQVLGEYAMYHCDSLTEFVIPDGESVLYLPDGLLSNAGALTSIRLGSRVLGVGEGAFLGCDALKTAYISPSVTMIGDTAFAAVNKNLVITGRRGSAAHICAQENGFVFISDAQDAVTALTFDTQSMTLMIGRQAELSVTAVPALPEGETLRWSSSEPEVAHVSGGVVRALGLGSAVITVSAENGVKAELPIVVKGTPAETLSLTPEELYVCIGAQKALTPVVTPAWGDTACDWSSDDERIAAVDENGVITGVAAGETIIRAKTESGCEAQAQIRVYKPVEEIRLTQGTTNLTLNVVDHPTMQIDAAAYPEDATHKDFSYESDNEAVVSVSDTGVMTVQGAGKATVTISARYTSGEPVTLPLQVTVVPYDFSGETLPEVSPMTYTGSVLTPSLSFMIGDRYLWKNTDYTMTNNGTSSLGQHTYTITGMGLFTGTLTGTYEIVEMRPTLSYSGNTIFEYGSVSLNPSSNALSKVKYKYALASDPQTWITGRPKEVGEYIQQFYIPDSYGVIGCEVLVNIRIVNSFAKEVTASAKTIHLYAGQTVDVKIGFVLEEGVTYFNPTMYVSTVDENGVIASASMRTSDTKYLRLITAASAEGEAEVTVYRYGKATDEVRIKVYVHPNPQTFRLPMIAQVEEEAFVNTSANVIRLEGKQVSIGARAFKDSAALWQVVLPKGEAVVAPDALEGTEAVLVCPSFNSQAAISAQESGLPYVAGN